MSIVVIHGAMRTGKTLNAEKFRELYHCKRVQDWSRRACGGPQFPIRGGDLLLTIEDPAIIRRELPNATLVPINVARRAIGLEPAPAGGFR